ALDPGEHSIRAWVIRKGTSPPNAWGHSTPACELKVLEVDDVNVDPNRACVDSNVTFVADPNPSGMLQCVEWQRQYKADSDANWVNDGNSQSGEHSIVLNTSKAGYYRYRAKNCAIECSGCDWVDSNEAIVVAVDKVDGPSYVCVTENADLEAEIAPSGESYPDGEPHWSILTKPTGSSATLSDVSDSNTTTLSGLDKVGYYAVKAQCCDGDGDAILIYARTLMELEKQGITTIDTSNNYSENTTIKVTVVDMEGDTCTCFTGDVNIGEDIFEPLYDEVYSQNGGYLPDTITFGAGDNGVKTFVAKSLAGPKGNIVPPNTARIITTDYPVHNAGGYLPVPQWTNDLGQVHGESSGDAYDWMETMIQDMWTTSGDLGIVLGKVDKYTTAYRAGVYGQIDANELDHSSPTDMVVNPFWTEMRLNSPHSLGCGQSDCPKIVNYTVIHEARHCYQDYLSSVDLGQPDDDPNYPDNDDDRDWLVETVPIDPNNYILDTNSSRPTCSGDKSFSGDGTPDSRSGNREEATEKDAFEYASAND
ncbi:MAG: hypothetical protein ACYTEX_22535, partial [Planctomycetota bacterium]